MPRQQSPIHIVLAAAERAELERRARSLAAAHRTVVRAKVILKVADGQSLSAIAREIMPGRRHVRKWAERFIRLRPGTAAAKPRVVGRILLGM